MELIMITMVFPREVADPLIQEDLLIHLDRQDRLQDHQDYHQFMRHNEIQ